MLNKDGQTLPFFSRFLEGQFCDDLSKEEMNEISGGLKLAPPSQDRIVTTLKYPSDREDGQPIRPPVTKKCPSDHEEYAVTQKYPSDGDDWLATTPIPKDSV
ncbi:serine endopeptidase inhibitor [Calothrix sp. HK-06]|nr:serine endopeptidase inhibitor [Calothrix sp. HK-06]